MSSPLFSDKAFDSARSATYEGEMTVSGTVNKTIALFLMMIIPVVLFFVVSTVAVKENKIADNALSTTTVSAKATNAMVSIGKKSLINFLSK